MARPPLLALKDVRLQDGPVMLFDGVDLGIEPRARACLVGRNGAGKSTLLRLLAREIEADGGERFVQPGLNVALVSQEPEVAGATLRDYATRGGAPDYMADAALQAFGLDPEKTAERLSGGEARRAALARAFASDPDVLLLDEPTNHLDIFAIETLEGQIAAARAAVLVISHDRAFLGRVTRQCFWLAHRKVRTLDQGFSAFEAWAETVEAEEAERGRRLDKAIAREAYTFSRSVTARRTRNEGRARLLQALRAEKSALLKDQTRAPELAVDSGGLAGVRVAEAKGIAKRFGVRTLVQGFSTRILRGDRVAIVGPNGAGKTTLVRLLLGELAPDEGSVKLGTNLEIAYLDQSREALKAETTLWDALAEGGGDQILVRGAPKHVAAYAKDFGFREAQLRQPVRSLSGGERNRLLLARALAKPANLLVLDEPTNDLDMETLDLLEVMLADYEGTLILVSHDRDFVDRLASSTIALDGRGRAVETPGGWTDFRRQNPDFFTGGGGGEARAAVRTPERSAAGPKRAAKLTYADSRRLAEAEAAVARLPGEIAALEARLGEAGLYAADPAAFNRTMAALDRARAALAKAEAEWLALEEKREMPATG